MEFNLTEYVDLEKILDALSSPKLTSEHARRLGLYYRLAKLNDGKIKVQYKQKLVNKETVKGRTISGTPAGRYYPVGNFLYGTYQWRHLRSSLYGDTETDIDAVNCHATILLNIAQYHGLTCSNLAAYVADRDSYIDDLDITQTDLDNYNKTEKASASFKDLSKLVYNITMYGGGIKRIKETLHMDRTPIRRDSIASTLVSEIKRLTQAIVAIDDYSMYKDKEDKSPASTLCRIIGDYEAKSVLKLMNAFKKEGIDVTMYIYDGFQVRCKDTVLIDRILKVNAEEDGLVFIRKPFYQTLDEVQVDDARTLFEVEAFMDSLDKLIGFTDQQCAQLFLDKHVGLDLEKSNGGIVLYNDQRGVWMEGDPEWLLMYEQIGISDGDEIRENYVQNARGYENVKKYLKPMAKSLANTEIIRELNDATIGKLFFNDGWVDLRTHEMGKCANARDIGFWKINRQMPDFSEYNWDHPDVVELMTKGLNMFEQDQLDVVLWAIARAAAGYVTDKLVYLIPGLRDSGKGVLCGLMENALGVFPNGICTHTTIPMHKDIENGDAKGRSWFIASNMHLARIALSNELVGSKKGRVDGNTIKSLASGGDKIKARLNHKDERDEHNNSTCFFFFNPPRLGGLPTFEPEDALEKCLLFEMPFSFTTDKQKLDSSPIYKPADHNIKTWIKSDAVGNAFIWVLIQSFRDRPLTKDDLPEGFRLDNVEKDSVYDNSPMAVWNKNFIVDPAGMTPASEFRDIMGLSVLKSTGWLKKNIRGLASYTTSDQQVDDKRVKMYLGFKRREVTTDD
jgi:hypothetical protein